MTWFSTPPPVCHNQKSLFYFFVYSSVFISVFLFLNFRKTFWTPFLAFCSFSSVEFNHSSVFYWQICKWHYAGKRPARITSRLDKLFKFFLYCTKQVPRNLFDAFSRLCISSWLLTFLSRISTSLSSMTFNNGSVWELAK